MWMDWLSLFLRWFHVIAGVTWIGASFYFIWLDNHLQTPPKWKQDKGIKGDLWAVHGGGFYEVAKYSYGPETMPTTLHWFKWEAYTTWISGFALLVLIYYFGASAYLIDPSVKALTETEAIIRGLAIIFGGFALYELGCRSILANHPKWNAVFLIIILCIATWLSTQWFSGRGAYIHVGALIGTLMAANVFVKIIPAQKAMVNAVLNKLEIDPRWGEQAKLRSVHNNYLTLPLLFIMISNHYPMTYQHPQNGLVLIAISLAAAWLRHFFNLRHIGQNKPMVLLSAVGAFLGIAIWVSMPPTPNPNESISSKETALVEMTPLDKQIAKLIDVHCVSCHSSAPSDPMFTIAPMGLIMDDWRSVLAKSELIIQRTAVTQDMPFLNKTAMTPQERDIFLQWQTQLNASEK